MNEWSTWYDGEATGLTCRDSRVLSTLPCNVGLFSGKSCPFLSSSTNKAERDAHGGPLRTHLLAVYGHGYTVNSRWRHRKGASSPCVLEANAHRCPGYKKGKTGRAEVQHLQPPQLAASSLASEPI